MTERRRSGYHGRGKRHTGRAQQQLAPSSFILQPDVGQDVDVGGRLRKLRTEQGLSIRALAEMSALNVNTLSLIENGKTSPSVSTLQRLAGALQVPITAFFENDEPTKKIVFQKAGQRRKGAFAHGSLEDLGSGLTLRGGVPLLVNLEPGADSGTTPIVHTGIEFVFCLKGHLLYSIEGQSYPLEPGDSLVFEAHLPHRWENSGFGNSQSLLVICPTEDDEPPAVRHFIASTGIQEET